MKKLVVVLSMGLMALSVVGWGKAGGAEEPARSAAADFQVTDLNGKPLSLSALKGKVVLLDFWASWCPPCRMEIPHFKELIASYQGKGLEVVGLAVGDQADAVKKFIQDNGVSYPVALSLPQVEQSYGGIRGVPTTFLVDKQGRIAKKYVGYQDKSVFEGEIQKLLAE